MKLNSVLIGSENPSRLVDYYSRLFGEPMMAEGGYTAWAIGDSGLVVGYHDRVKGDNTQPGRIIWNIESPDVKADFERLKGLGAVVVADPYSPDVDVAETALVATFSDPDGNYFQLMSPMQA